MVRIRQSSGTLSAGRSTRSTIEGTEPTREACRDYSLYLRRGRPRGHRLVLQDLCWPSDSRTNRDGQRPRWTRGGDPRQAAASCCQSPSPTTTSSPDSGRGTPVSLHLRVDDVAAVANAANAGGHDRPRTKDRRERHRVTLHDPFGHRWMLNDHD
ncbi:MAG: hypothetical protein IPL45_11870 [Actinomycetales bacterium]|nr:hypothetical protein [Actinomycetales bacterium]